jgi:hypothetical protein
MAKGFIKRIKKENAACYYSIYEGNTKGLYKVEKWNGGAFPSLEMFLTQDDALDMITIKDRRIPKFVLKEIIKL